MTAAGWIALGCAIFGAFSYGAGSVLQAVGARRSKSTVRTLGHPLYLLGVGCDLLAWAASMVALRELAVYQVQSVLAGSLAVTVVMARLFLASRLRKRDVAAVVITIGALTVLAMSAGPQEQVPASTELRIGFCVAAVAVVVIGWAATKIGSPGIVSALAGLSFGGAALSGRALTLPTGDLSATALAIVTEPLVGALVIFAAAGMLLYTNALRNGQVGPVTAVLWIGEVVAPSVVGLTVLGDMVRPGWDLPSAIAGVVIVAAAVLLATAPATSATGAAGSEPEATAAGPAAWPPTGATAVAVGATWPPTAAGAPAGATSAGWSPTPAGAAAAGWPPTGFAAPAFAAGAAAGWSPTAAPAGGMPGHPPGAARPAAPTYAAGPPWAALDWPEPSGYAEPIGAQRAGTILWWGPSSDPRPIWVPPDRTPPATGPRVVRPATGEPPPQLAAGRPSYRTPPSRDRRWSSQQAY
jgi:hypothetical protein